MSTYFQDRFQGAGAIAAAAPAPRSAPAPLMRRRGRRWMPLGADVPPPQACYLEFVGPDSWTIQRADGQIVKVSTAEAMQYPPCQTAERQAAAAAKQAITQQTAQATTPTTGTGTAMIPGGGAPTVVVTRTPVRMISRPSRGMESKRPRHRNELQPIFTPAPPSSTTPTTSTAPTRATSNGAGASRRPPPKRTSATTQSAASTAEPATIVQPTSSAMTTTQVIERPSATLEPVVRARQALPDLELGPISPTTTRKPPWIWIGIGAIAVLLLSK